MNILLSWLGYKEFSVGDIVFYNDSEIDTSQLIMIKSIDKSHYLIAFVTKVKDEYIESKLTSLWSKNLIHKYGELIS